MDKRQDGVPRPLPAAAPWLLGFLLLSISLLSACRGAPNPIPEGPAPSPDLPSGTPTHTPSHTPPPSTSPPEPPALTQTPTPTPDCRTSGGQLQTASFHSRTLDAPLAYHLYLPPCYPAGPDQGYPVLYLLHGLSYTHDQWPRLGLVSRMDALIASGDLPPFIVVLPQEARFDPPQQSLFGQALVHDLIPWIDARHPTRAEAPFRAIGGLSRGAAWAVHLAFSHPDLFGRVGAHSLPLFETDGARVYAWLTQNPPESLPTVYIDIGRGDPERQTAQDFADLLDTFSVAHEWHLFNGEHSEGYWAEHLLDYLRWYAQNW